MRERPILFSGPMVRQVLAGLKTQTRRPVKHRSHGKTVPIPGEWEPQSSTAWPFPLSGGNPEFLLSGRYQVFARPGLGMVALPCPYGEPGDRLWVRETWGMSYVDLAGDRPHVQGGTWGSPARPGRVPCAIFRADGEMPDDSPSETARWSPSIHMPRWASRLTLDVLSVRVERVQDISEEDARAEGLVRHTAGWTDGDCLYDTLSARDAFGELWEGAYPGSWQRNDWVWVIEFRRAEASR